MSVVHMHSELTQQRLHSLNVHPYTLLHWQLSLIQPPSHLSLSVTVVFRDCTEKRLFVFWTWMVYINHRSQYLCTGWSLQPAQTAHVQKGTRETYFVIHAVWTLWLVFVEVFHPSAEELFKAQQSTTVLIWSVNTNYWWGLPWNWEPFILIVNQCYLMQNDLNTYYWILSTEVLFSVWTWSQTNNDSASCQSNNLIILLACCQTDAFFVSISVSKLMFSLFLPDGADYLKEILPVFFAHHPMNIRRLRQILHKLDDGNKPAETSGLNLSALHEQINAWVASATASQIRQLPEILKKVGAENVSSRLHNKLQRIDSNLNELCSLANEVNGCH